MTPQEFVPRLTRPEAGNKYYIRKANGGWSSAIAGKSVDSKCNVLSNCVGYAYGRFNEIAGQGKCFLLKPVNAEDFMKHKGKCESGMTPKPGACMVWKSAKSGHVAIVEKVVSDTEVVSSESFYNGKAFFTKTRKRGNGDWGAHGYEFLGFIYNPAITDEEDEDMTGEQIYEKLQEYLGTQEVPGWAKAELQEAVAMGLTDGSNPMQLIPRYQAAILAKRAVERAGEAASHGKVS